MLPALPGCHPQGDTLTEAERNVTEAIELYLETLLSQGEDLPRKTGSALIVRCFVAGVLNCFRQIVLVHENNGKF